MIDRAPVVRRYVAGDCSGIIANTDGEVVRLSCTDPSHSFQIYQCRDDFRIVKVFQVFGEINIVIIADGSNRERSQSNSCGWFSAKLSGLRSLHEPGHSIRRGAHEAP
jgi:hypothetical protein